MTNRELRLRCVEIAMQNISNQVNFEECKILVALDKIFEYAGKIETFVNQAEPDAELKKWGE